jgi:hypothetical protein
MLLFTFASFFSGESGLVEKSHDVINYHADDYSLNSLNEAQGYALGQVQLSTATQRLYELNDYVDFEASENDS